MQSCLESDIGRERTEGTGNMKIHLLHWGRVQAQKSINRREHHVRVNQPSRSSPTVASEEVQEASPKGCDSGMPQKTPGLPINRHFIITKAHCQYSTKRKKQLELRAVMSTWSHSFLPPTVPVLGNQSLITQCPCRRPPRQGHHRRSTCGSPRWPSRQPPEWCPS
jgi:hypothetical protein